MIIEKNPGRFPIVFSTNNDDAVNVAAAIKTLVIRNLFHQYDIYILHTGLDEKNEDSIRNKAKDSKNIYIHFKNVGELSNLFGYKNKDVPREMYFLLVPNLFRDFDKVLCLDSEISCESEISEIFNIDMKDRTLAAALDIIFVAMYNANLDEVTNYANNVLKLEDPNRYFSTGVVLFNIKEIHKIIQECELVEFHYETGEYSYQDFLNLKFHKNFKCLDMKWNFTPFGVFKNRLIKEYAGEIAD